MSVEVGRCAVLDAIEVNNSGCSAEFLARWLRLLRTIHTLFFLCAPPLPLRILFDYQFHFNAFPLAFAAVQQLNNVFKLATLTCAVC